MATVTTPTTPTQPSRAPAPPAPGDSTAELMAVRHRVTVEEYHRMAEAGVFGPEPRIELIEGMLVDKMTKNPPHNLACDLIQRILGMRLPAAYFGSMATSMTIAERDGEPEPDAWVSVVIPAITPDARTPADAALVIEVSDASYALDRHQKATVYAAGGVPAYWIVDLNRRRLEVLTKPAARQGDDPARYEEVRALAEHEEVALLLDGREVGRFVVREILP